MMRDGSSMGDVQPTTPVPCALYLSGFEPHDGRRGVVFSNCPYMEESPMKVNPVCLLSKFSEFTHQIQ